MLLQYKKVSNFSNPNALSYFKPRQCHPDAWCGRTHTLERVGAAAVTSTNHQLEGSDTGGKVPSPPNKSP